MPILRATDDCDSYGGLAASNPKFCCASSCGSCKTRKCKTRGEKDACCPRKIKNADIPCGGGKVAPCVLKEDEVEDSDDDSSIILRLP